MLRLRTSRQCRFSELGTTISPAFIGRSVGTQSGFFTTDIELCPGLGEVSGLIEGVTRQPCLQRSELPGQVALAVGVE